ncbi:aminoglycoside phosphotransferase family protein [Streptomyces sp. NRRL S-241]|uniref:phosphotransferase n=1 Tax=Streptomyces sp. NRRL S-241 TaxID=1463896 RepID=UPI0004C1A481|nr:aminoglycoside phosphotransferase family protein [Streptomyces sp. NRRL S-241]
MSRSQLPSGQDPFTESSAARAVLEAVRLAGAPQPHDLELLRLGENALFASPAQGLVYRVARSDGLTAKVEKELATARWLVAQGFPGLLPRDEFRQPVSAEGRLVTFWQYVPRSPREPLLTDLAVLLRDLHALPAPDFPVPVLNPFPLMRDRLREAGAGTSDRTDAAVPEKDLAFLAAACDAGEGAFKDLVAADPAIGLVHGDAHRGNLLSRGDRVLLIDYEAVALGPRSWDLLPTATAADRFGLAPAEYKEFCAVYGADVTQQHGYRILRTVRELGMTTWLMQNVPHSPAAAHEFAVRMDSLRKGDHAARWHAL